MVLAAGMLPGSAAPVAVAPMPGAGGIGDGYFPEDGNGGIDVLRYDIRNRYDFGRRMLSGRTTLTVRSTQQLDRFNLDLLLRVRRVTVDGRRAAFSKPNRHELQVTPGRPIDAGERFRVVVDYRGRPASIGWRGEHAWVADGREVVTMGQPHIAAWWFPANDHPLDRARTDLRITTARSMDVVANGTRVGRRVHGRLATTRWRSREPMLPYLVYFAAGDFRIERGTTRGIPWLIAVSQRLAPAQQRSSLRQLRQSGRITAWLQREIGAYPFGSTGGLVTDIDVGFALENQTRPTYPWLGSGDRWLVVHELAHQWFGNSVAIRGWRDIWLNEGLATYLEWRYDESRGLRSTQARLRDSYRRYRGWSAFWELRIDDPGPQRIFDDAVYERGAMTLAALRVRIGRSAFRTLAEQVGDQDLDGFFQAWLRDPGPPDQTAANGLR